MLYENENICRRTLIILRFANIFTFCKLFSIRN